VLRFIRFLGKSAMLSVNIFAAVCLAFAYLAVHIHPAQAPFLPFFGISYGVLLLVNISFIGFWLLAKKRLALISAITILLGVNHLFAYFQPMPFSLGKAPEGKNIKVLSHNVRLFGWYNWRTNIEDRDQMFRRLELIDADVMCFQEFFHHSGPDKFETRETLKRVTGAPYLYEAYTAVVGKNQNYGIATLSKHPIIHSGRIDFAGERSNVCIYVDLDIEGDTVRVYNAHVASIRFSDRNYAFIEEVMNQPRDGNADLSEGINILIRLARAYRLRAEQTQRIVAHMAQSPYPVVFCGDMNDTPVSYSYGLLSETLNDSFRKSGWGIGNTYIGMFPSFRIDYIFCDKRFESNSYTTHAEETSDHHAISARIFLNKKE
jgi:endonuclease/exonuclease/phosphatase family metal-dependent hydrolase